MLTARIAVKRVRGIPQLGFVLLRMGGQMSRVFLSSPSLIIMQNQRKCQLLHSNENLSIKNTFLCHV